MAIEFHCPNGHILEVDDEHAGKQIRCPACDARCLVPPRSAATTAPPPAPRVEDAIPQFKPRKVRKRGRRRGVSTRRQPLDVSVPEVHDEPLTEGPASQQPAATGLKLRAGIRAADREKLHFECQKCGQILEVSNEMLGQDLACAACGRPFKAELKRSVEYIREKDMKEEREERLLSKRWLTIALFASLFVAACLIGMIVWSAGR
jgi:DNA-directed RNA polymerase subunit RPC12/RpoP